MERSREDEKKYGSERRTDSKSKREGERGEKQQCVIEKRKNKLNRKRNKYKSNGEEKETKETQDGYPFPF